MGLLKELMHMKEGEHPKEVDLGSVRGYNQTYRGHPGPIRIITVTATANQQMRFIASLLHASI